MLKIRDLKEIESDILSGGDISAEEAYALEALPTDELIATASAITQALQPKEFDSCSIINARSGKCPENCKWCAQSAHYSTGCDTYDIVGEQECMELAKFNEQQGVKRFSLVASGRRVTGKALEQVCDLFRKIMADTSLKCCASLGLLGEDDLAKLRDCGVKRYHCNLESAPSHFPTLCTTHTIADKIATINAARKLGFEICSGGIIGMGESEKQRIEFALTLKEIAPDSIPINILCPIPGTPLEHVEPLSDEQILRTVAIFRIVNPRAVLRFAGGRMKLSPEAQLHAMKIAVNGSIVGDMLTTVGSPLLRDKDMVSRAGYAW